MLSCRKWALCRARGLFSRPRRTAVTHSEPTKAFPKWSPETAMLSAPFGCTHPPPRIPPFQLKLNSLVLRQYRCPFREWKVRTYLQGRWRKWHHKTKVSCQIYLATSGKGLLCVQLISLVSKTHMNPCCVWKWPYSQFLLHLNIVYFVTVTSKNFLWVELHTNYMAPKHASPEAVWVLAVWVSYLQKTFHENPRNTLRSNGIEIGYTVSKQHGISWQL